ncbi:MAG: flavodoxin family protein [Firmicutes bacterium]|nr:flavodoxin family protein [Bacillota bacterium]
MKIVVLNGSPRQGNTLAAAKAFTTALGPQHSFEIIDTYKLKVSPCVACLQCQNTKGCIEKDDSNMIVDTLVAADMIVFASPVYWWGLSAQLKLVIDKMYCKAAQMKGKKIGVIVVGGANTDSEQYKLIEDQFRMMGNYLNWDIKFHKSYSATKPEEIMFNEAAMEELRLIGEAM